MDQQSIYGLAGLAIMLVVESLFDMQLLNCRPSVVAAAVLYAERRQRGAVPFWPSSLAKATGYQDMGTPELAMAVRTAQKLCRKVRPCPPPPSRPRPLPPCPPPPLPPSRPAPLPPPACAPHPQGHTMY
jgi:pentatricopeptide repeat domain-containing protein 1